jgi:hypothetical protein
MNAVRTLNTANGIGMADRAGVTDRLLRRGVRELGGVGGGGIFVPMLALIIGFDPKSYAAMSKCEHPQPVDFSSCCPFSETTYPASSHQLRSRHHSVLFVWGQA